MMLSKSMRVDKFQISKFLSYSKVYASLCIIFWEGLVTDKT